MKLWDKGISTDKNIDRFTVGNDRELDLFLVKYDVMASVAHAKMLGKIGLLSATETKDLVSAWTLLPRTSPRVGLPLRRILRICTPK